MAFTRITDADLEGKGVIGQPEVPGLTALEMQQSVEQIVREVAIPGLNRLIGELEAGTGAASLGMERPAGLPETVPATVQGVTAAHLESRENPHEVTAAQVGAYTKAETDAAINNKVVEIGAGDMAQAVYAANGQPGVVDTAVRAQSAAAADDGVKLYTHTRTGTVHNFVGSGAIGRARMTADVQAGDTFAVNGVPVTAWMGAEDAATMMQGQPYTGRWVSFMTEGGSLNFKSGGGVPESLKQFLVPANIREDASFSGAGITVEGSYGPLFAWWGGGNSGVFIWGSWERGKAVQSGPNGQYVTPSAVRVLRVFASGGLAYMTKNGVPLGTASQTSIELRDVPAGTVFLAAIANIGSTCLLAMG